MRVRVADLNAKVSSFRSEGRVEVVWSLHGVAFCSAKVIAWLIFEPWFRVALV